jgi:hypothetical protein
LVGVGACIIEDLRGAPAAQAAPSNGQSAPDSTNEILKILHVHGSDTFEYHYTANAIAPDLHATISIDQEEIHKDMVAFVHSSATTIAAAHCDDHHRQSLAYEISQALLKEPGSNFELMKAKVEYLHVQPSVAAIHDALLVHPPSVRKLHL